MNTQEILMGSWLVQLMLCVVIIIMTMGTRSIKIPFIEGSKVQGWMKDEGNKKALLSLAFIAGCLAFVDAICAGFGFTWWQKNFNQGSFWPSQFGILFGVFGLMWKCKAPTKVACAILLVAIIGGWVWLARQPTTHVIEKGVESPVFYMENVERVKPIPLWIRTNGEGEWKFYRLEEWMKKSAITMQFKSEDEDFYVVERTGGKEKN